MSKEIKEKHPMREALMVGGIVFVASVTTGFLMAIPGTVVATVSVIISVMIGLLVCLLGCMKNTKIANWIACTMAIMFFGWIGVGGIDCDPPDDADLMLPQSNIPYTSEGNGWVLLSNVLSRVEVLENETNLHSKAFATVKDNLLWYVDPERYEIDSEAFPCLTNAATCDTYVKSCLKSNEWLLAGIDAVLASPTYAPPPPVNLSGNQFFAYPELMPANKILHINRSFMLARIKWEIRKGNFDVAVECYGKSLRLATLLQAHSGAFFEYYAGTAMIWDDVSFLERMVDDNAIASDKLLAFGDLMKDVPDVSPEAAAQALKREYAYFKEICKNRPADIVVDCIGGSGFDKVLFRSPFGRYYFCRYIFKPNQTLHAIAKSIRCAIQRERPNSKCEEDGCWRTSFMDAVLPNSFGRIVASTNYKHYLDRFKDVPEVVSSVRRKIAGRINASQDQK